MFGWSNFWNNHPSDFWKFWNCPSFTGAISKCSKIHLSNLSQTALPNMWLLVLIDLINKLYHIRAYSSSLLCAIIAHNHLPIFKIFSNFVHFCPNFKYFALFWKNAHMSFLSTVGPAHRKILDFILCHLYLKIVLFC